MSHLFFLSNREIGRFLGFIILLLTVSSCNKIEHDDQVMVHNGAYSYQGQMLNGQYNGYGELSLNDSVVYAGMWRQGKRYGNGVCYDSLGRRIVGKWHADTLVSGTRTDSLGTYVGQFNRHNQASGVGTYDSLNANNHYEGFWHADKRDGFGFASTERKLRLGEWKENHYLGERMVYTNQRIYGIDISRFQHDIGKKHYPINWRQIRITHLGSISKKIIQGEVNYPVSFCYIKSTEGTTIRNKYYKSDYRNAKKNRIHCGSYHFFSINSNGKVQAEYFLRNTFFRKGDFPPVLDLEPLPSQIKKMGGTEVMFREVRTWMHIVEHRIGVRPILYINQAFVNKYLPDAADLRSRYNIWIARYGEYKPDVHLIYWQLSPDGRIQGIRGDVDINVFNGYHDRFEVFLNAERIK